MYTRDQAEKFFGELRSASVELLKSNKIPTSPGNKTKSWKHGNPIGVIEHYTAGIDFWGSCRWLNSSGNDNSSCHFVVSDRKIREVEAVFNKFDSLKVLPVAVILLSDLDNGTWHAGWVNNLCVGIENRNAGILRGNQSEGWTWWPKNWTSKFPHEELNKTPVWVGNSWWEPFTHSQLIANIIICRMLLALYPVEANWFLPHSAVDKNKMDTGRAFPFSEVREASLIQTPLEELAWLKSYKDDVTYMKDFSKKDDNRFLAELSHRQGDRSGLNAAICEDPKAVDLSLLTRDGNWPTKLNAIRRGLSRLGYYVGGEGSELDKDTLLAVFQLQKMAGLIADKIPGNATQRALMARLRQFDLCAD